MDINKLLALFGKEYRDKELVDFFYKDGLDIVKEIRHIKLHMNNVMKQDNVNI